MHRDKPLEPIAYVQIDAEELEKLRDEVAAQRYWSNLVDAEIRAAAQARQRREAEERYAAWKPVKQAAA